MSAQGKAALARMKARKAAKAKKKTKKKAKKKPEQTPGYFGKVKRKRAKG